MTVTEFNHSHLISLRFKYRKAFDFAHEVDHSVTPHLDPIFLHYGMPHPGFFPISLMTVTTKDRPFGTKGQQLTAGGTGVDVDGRKVDGGIDIPTGLQYCGDYGVGQLQLVFQEIISKTHPPAYADWDTVVSFGTGDAVYKVFDLFLDPGDSVLVEQFTFVPTLSSITCFGAELVPVELLYTDGIDVAKLLHLLANFQHLHPGKRFPKCLYTIPSGHNPIGVTQSLQTRQKIYQLCEQYDIIIVEDDPYGYMALTKFNAANPFDDALTSEQFLAHYVPKSYIELDTSHRVIRMDSFSKIFAPGFRLGMITAHRSFIDKIKLFISISSKHPSGLSQMMLVNIYRGLGGFDGFVRWLIKVSHEYSERKQIFMENLTQSRAFTSGLMEILEPEHGMFVTVKFNFARGTDVDNALRQLENIGLEKGIVFVLGTRLTFDEANKKLANFVRLALSPTGDSQELELGAQRFIDTVETYFGVK